MLPETRWTVVHPDEIILTVTIHVANQFVIVANRSAIGGVDLSVLRARSESPVAIAEVGMLPETIWTVVHPDEIVLPITVHVTNQFVIDANRSATGGVDLSVLRALSESPITVAEVGMLPETIWTIVHQDKIVLPITIHVANQFVIVAIVLPE